VTPNSGERGVTDMPPEGFTGTVTFDGATDDGVVRR
jgi:hypothetical protein